MSKSVRVPYETTIGIRDRCLCLHVQRAARALARHFDEALRPLGLTNGQFSLLMALNRPTPPGMSAVATLLAMDRTTLTAALKPLERRSLVNVKADPVDGRSRLVALTSKGHSLLSRALPVWGRCNQQLEARLPGRSVDRLRDGLRTLSQDPVSQVP